MRWSDIRVRARRRLANTGFNEEHLLVLLAVAIGAATGMGGFVFYSLIEWATEFAYGEDHGLYGGRWYMLLLLPTAGALTRACAPATATTTTCGSLRRTAGA